jgi:putative transposase
MPNHVHGILIIDKNANVLLNGCDGDVVGTRLIVGTRLMVETRLIASLPSPTGPPSPMEPSPTETITETPSPTGKPGGKPGGFAGNKNPMFHDNISRIIRWYKGRCSFEIHKTRADFAWQSLFHDHIIRNNTEFERIQDYIAKNPRNWKEDKFYE